MMRTEYKLTLDLNGAESCPVIWAKQGDDASRFVCVTLAKDGAVYIPPEGTTAMLRCVKQDLHSCLNPAIINDDGTVTVELTEQVLAVAGVVRADICLRGADGAVLSTVSFEIEVETVPLGMSVVSSNEFKVLEELAERAEALEDGDSAYEIALRNGFEGTEDEWLASLKGEKGEKGDTGAAGTAGADGEDGCTPVKGIDYFTEADRQELVEDVLAELPVSVSEDGFTDFTGLRQATSIAMVRDAQTVTVTTTMQGDVTAESVVTLDESGYPVKIVTDAVECGLSWTGFADTELGLWEGGSY